ncbi:MAG: ATP-binding protein [Bacteriovoracaceae bacterium]|nr:ATP-binding protein [Bacteroidota bacterium]
MDVIIYSFFIVTGVAGLCYYTIRRRYARLLEEEQEKSFALRNSELLLASEKQRLESALKEKEMLITEIRTRILAEESKAGSLSSEVLSKDKQIQSLSAQLQHESSQRKVLEQELSSIEQQLSSFRSKATVEENKASTLSSDVSTKEQRIHSLSAELQQQIHERTRAERTLAEKEHTAVELAAQMRIEVEQRAVLAAELQQQTNNRMRVEQELAEREHAAETLAAQIKAEGEQRAVLSTELAAKEQQFQSTLTQQTMELQQLNDALQKEIESRRSIETNSQETIHGLQQQVEQLQNELHSVRGANDSLSTVREHLTAEFLKTEEQLRQQLGETELLFTVAQQDMEKMSAVLQEQTSIRQATEHALQESKQKLYALIGDLEQKVKDQSNAIAVLQTELAQTTSDLESADQSIHNVLRNIPIPVFVVNENGLCEYCNTALEELVGYGMTELSGKHFSRLFPEDERAFYEEQWTRTNDRAEQFQGETRILAATNDPISATINFVDIRPNGDTVKYVGCILDRTTEKDSKKHFAAVKEREQELLNLKSRFIGMVSNQLRTSLVTIATNTELLERFMDTWSNERRYHSFLRINESIRQMIELVRDVTFTTRASAEQYTLTIGSVNLETIFQSAAKELTDDLESHHHFILSEKGDIASTALDETLIKTIVQQLLSNAFKYSRDNTEVHAHIEQSGTSCIISIADQGIGIPAAEQKHLFSSFFRASNVNNIYGTGLGLTIVQQCVHLHSGTITIESELNKGTTVTVTLPLRTTE